jgi:hypothetical protein
MPADIAGGKAMERESDWHFDKMVGRDATVPGYHSEPFLHYEPQVTNGQGATLLRVGVGPEREEYFLYQNGPISFRFMALRFRRSAKAFVMTNTYQVILPRPYRRSHLEVPNEVMDEVEREISAALMVYPPLDLRVWTAAETQPGPLPELKRVTFH